MKNKQKNKPRRARPRARIKRQSYNITLDLTRFDLVYSWNDTNKIVEYENRDACKITRSNIIHLRPLITFKIFKPWV